MRGTVPVMPACGAGPDRRAAAREWSVGDGMVSTVSTDDSETLPAPLRGAVWLLTAEAAALAAVTLFLIYEDFTAPAHDLVSALLITVFSAGGTLLLALLARALGRRRVRARAPAIVLQLMLLPIGYYMILGGLAWLGVPLIALGVVVCALLLAPSTNRALGVS